MICGKMYVIVQIGGDNLAHKKGKGSTTHGMSKTKFYNTWLGMKSRCYNEKEISYPNYGGRGIAICEKWMIFENFKDDMHEAFLEHVELYGEKNTSIERVNNNGNYEPDNCKWATTQEQNRNTRQVKLYLYKNQMLNLMEISEIEGINYRTLRARIFQYGWTLEESLKKSKNKWARKGHELFEHKGEMKTLSEIAKGEGINKTTLFDRIKRQKMTIEEAVSINNGRKKRS